MCRLTTPPTTSYYLPSPSPSSPPHPNAHSLPTLPYPHTYPLPTLSNTHSHTHTKHTHILRLRSLASSPSLLPSPLFLPLSFPPPCVQAHCSPNTRTDSLTHIHTGPCSAAFLSMAVQAQHHPLGDHRNKATHLPGFDFSAIDTTSVLAPIPFQGNLPGDCKVPQTVFIGGSQIESMQRLSQQGASPPSGFVLPSFPLYQGPLVQTDFDAVAIGGNKRRRKESGFLHQNHMQKYQLQLGVDLNQTSGCSPASLVPIPGVKNNVSTGLRLAFDDERSTVTSSRLDSYTSSSHALKDELSAQLSQHQDELNQLIQAQAEHLRQILEDRAQRQSKGLLAAIEHGFSKRLRDKEVEMERVNKRNLELEDSIKQLSVESQMWQSKAKNNEAMVAILRSNLQQAVLVQHHNKEQQSRLEGCGDSEVDDAASVYMDDNLHAQQMRAMASLKKAPFINPASGTMKGTPQSSIMNNNEVSIMRVCRRCRAKEASAVLLPCLHLCLCVACKDECERCPVCSSLKSASVEVFLS